MAIMRLIGIGEEQKEENGEGEGDRRRSNTPKSGEIFFFSKSVLLIASNFDSLNSI